MLLLVFFLPVCHWPTCCCLAYLTPSLLPMSHPHSYYHTCAYGLYFASMNYTVHAVMYLYYALAAVKIRLCKPHYVTFLQVSEIPLLIRVLLYCS